LVKTTVSRQKRYSVDNFLNFAKLDLTKVDEKIMSIFMKPGLFIYLYKYFVYFFIDEL